jgi:thiol-disulfide isomerase/thioredoxin
MIFFGKFFSTEVLLFCNEKSHASLWKTENVMDNYSNDHSTQSSAIELRSAESLVDVLKKIQTPQVTPAQRADFWKRKLLTSTEHIVRFLQDFIQHLPHSSQPQTKHPIVFMIYATWCGVCKIEKPIVDAFADKYHSLVPTFKMDGSLLYRMNIPQEFHTRMQSSASSVLYADSYDTVLADSDNVGELLQQYPVLFIYHPVYGEFLQLAKAQDLEECAEYALKEARQTPRIPQFG